MNKLILLSFLICASVLNAQNDFPTMRFDGNLTTFNAAHKEAMYDVVDYMFENETASITIISLYEKERDLSPFVNRGKKIRTFITDAGINPDRVDFRTAKRSEMGILDSSDVIFELKNMEFEPCGNMGLIINFKKNSAEIFETNCDSVIDIYRDISRVDSDYAIIAVITDSIPESLAVERAEVAKNALVELGIPEEKIVIHKQRYPMPKNNHWDWPFYPPEFEYEIGVTIMLVW